MSAFPADKLCKQKLIFIHKHRAKLKGRTDDSDGTHMRLRYDFVVDVI